MVQWERGRSYPSANQQRRRNDGRTVRPVPYVVSNDERASVGGSSFERSKTEKDSSVERVECSLSDNSRGVRDNRPSSVRRLEKAQGNLRKAVGLGNRIAVSFPYDKELVEAVKTLVGRRWEPDGKRWICEPSADLAKLLNEHMFVIDDFANQILSVAAPQNCVTQQGHVLIVKTAYNPPLIEALRQIPSRKWDKSNRQWTFSVVAISRLAELAGEYGLQWLVGDKQDDNPQVMVEKGWLSVAFSADRDIQETISELYGTRFDPTQMRWLVPMDYAPEIKVATDRYQFDTSDDVQREFEKVRYEIELLELSKSQNAVLDIPGLQVDLMPFQKAGVLYVLKAIGAEQNDNGKWIRRTLSLQESHD
jgi:hypothetical protein